MKALILCALFFSSCSIVKKQIAKHKLRNEYMQAYEYNKGPHELKRVMKKHFSSWHSVPPGYADSADMMIRTLHFHGYVYNKEHKVDYFNDFHVLEESAGKIVILYDGIIYKLESKKRNKTNLKAYPIVKYIHPTFSSSSEKKEKDGFSIDMSYLKEFKTNGGPVNVDKLLTSAKRSFTHEWFLLEGIDKNATQELSNKIDSALEQSTNL